MSGPDRSPVGRRSEAAAGALIVWLCLSAAATADAQSLGSRSVFVVSVDGLRPDVLLRARTPNIDNLLNVGCFSWRAQTVSPSVTLPAHCSMVSGQLPEIHRITWNEHRPEQGRLRVPTVFSVAKEYGLSSAVFVSKRKLEAIAPGGSVDECRVLEADCMAVAKAASAYIARYRPSVCLIHLSDVDGAGHSSGWGSDRQVAAMERCDTAIGVLLGGIRDAGISGRSVMIVTSDHGGHGKGHGSKDPLDCTIPWICAGKGVAVRREIVSPVHICDTAAMALLALGIRSPDYWHGRVIPGVFPAAHAGTWRRHGSTVSWCDTNERVASIGRS